MRWTSWVVTSWMLTMACQHQVLEAKRVVHIPAPSTSHVKCHTQVARALQEYGHETWIVVPHYQLRKGVQDMSNITVIPYEMSENHEEKAMEVFTHTYFSNASVDAVMRTVMFPAVRKMCDEILRNKDLEQEIRNVKPDLIILDNTPLIYTLVVLPYKLQVPFAMIGTVYDVHSMRMPYSSAANLMQFGSMSHDMPFTDRVKNMFMHVLLYIYSPFLSGDVASIYAPEMPFISNSDLLARAELWLVEIDHILDYPRPTLPNVKMIGGTVTQHAKPLPPKLQDFMDSAKQGVVIVTFGGSVLGLPKTFSDKLLEVFYTLPFKVVFRSNVTSSHSDKVWTSTWLPQNDLLGHTNTKLFFSHCGNNGQYEALFHAVPILCNPIFGDQYYNSERIRKKGFGEVVDFRIISKEELFDRIMTVAQEPRYKLAISKASSLFRQQYGVPMQEAAKWLDHVMEHGGEYMQYAGQKMPLYQFLGLDVLAFVFALGTLSSVMVYCCIKMLCRRYWKRRPKID